ncbi:hypothetical protein [Burkholderia sp. RF4-BP95]|uniref:hypothetical protein n=1 Tax=Burkholderia sp. RF4-BP95 TaxID=1637845 RepID=UPI0007593CFA|nr:hypothetical protein [Burkholderia sp. RF4-BP95]KUY84279.1 hypothetical protein WS46_09435 [Burkholderia sp. RF4-BP95]
MPGTAAMPRAAGRPVLAVLRTTSMRARRALRGGAVMQPCSAPVVGALHGVDLFAGLIFGQIPAYRPHLPCIAMALSNLDAALAGGKRFVHDPHSGPGDKRREL